MFVIPSHTAQGAISGYESRRAWGLFTRVEISKTKSRLEFLFLYSSPDHRTNLTAMETWSPGNQVKKSLVDLSFESFFKINLCYGEIIFRKRKLKLKSGINLIENGLKDCRKERDQPQGKFISKTIEERVV